MVQLKKVNWFRRSFAVHRFTWIVACVVFLLVGAGVVYAAFSVQYWKSYDNNKTTAKVILREDIDKVFAVKANSEQDRKAMLHSLKLIHEKTQRYNEHCQSQIFYKWQEVLPAIAKTTQACYDAGRSVVDMGNQIAELVAYVAVREHLALSITELVNATNTVEESQWDEMSDRWKKLTETLKESDASETSRLEVKSLQENASAIAATWGELSQANKVKDRSKYEAATAKLTELYANFDAISVTQVETTEALIAKVDMSYQKMLKQ